MEEKRPREGRPARYLAAPEVVALFGEMDDEVSSIVAALQN